MVVRFTSGVGMLLHQNTALKASPWGEAGECNEPDEGASVQKCEQHFAPRSPSSASLFAQYLLPREKALMVVGLTNDEKACSAFA